jgi:hypothetical protein
MFIAAGCRNDDRAAGWTTEEARKVATIRGMKVRVRECRGVGSAESGGRYLRFRCVASARLPREAYDSVGIFYTLVVRGQHDYVLESVRFIGGPGIP